ncbi:MAG: serine protease, partial [Flavobacterium sp.]|nr:serine protease [Flavobacterium sp.]
DLSSYVNTKRPNDVVKATFIRNGKAMQVPVTITKNEFVNAELNGIIFENLDTSDKKRFNIDYGVKVKDITNKHFMSYYNALKGNILIGINDAKAVDTETVANILNEKLSNESVVELTMINKQGVLVKFFVEVN